MYELYGLSKAEKTLVEEFGVVTEEDGEIETGEAAEALVGA